MIRNVIILLAHDLAVGIKNKTLYLILGIPLFVYVTLTFLDPADTSPVPATIALLESESYEPVLLDSIRRASGAFVVHGAPDETVAMRWLKDRRIDGILTPAGDTPQLRLTVVRLASAETLNILQQLSILQDRAENNPPGWIAAVQALQAGSIRQQTLPTWVLMMVLLVSFIVLPAQVGEEKEKQLLTGWMQTPVRESDWLAAKLAYGMALILVSVVLLQWMSGTSAGTHGMRYLAMLVAGCFCFGSLGITIGLLCRNQASARTLGILCYLPLLLPAALSDMSRNMRNLAPWGLSYHFYEPVRSLLLEDGVSAACFTRSGASLVAIGLLACLVSHWLIRKRWLM